MAIDTTIPHSRRALLGGTLGALAAVAAQALGRPLAAAAADGDVIHVGDARSGTTSTSIRNAVNNDSVFIALSTATNGHPSSGRGIGIQGGSDAGAGVSGGSSTGTGVHGGSDSGTGVHGGSVRYAGIYGASGKRSQVPDPPRLRVGVYGWAPPTTGFAPSYGVVGRSASGLGIGVLGSCDAGTGVSATSKTGYALSAAGRVHFKTSGIGTVSAGSANAVIDSGVPISDATRVLVTIHGDPGGSTVLKRVVRNVGADTFKVVLTGPAANACEFSWFLIG